MAPPSKATIPPQFKARKESILSQLALDPSDYDDKSPKGSVDVQILDLIRLINSTEGWVTTSSCSGRVAVFVEGPKKPSLPRTATSKGSDGLLNGGGDGDSADAGPDRAENDSETTVKTAPGGKGGGQWLYVSHDPIPTTAAETSATTAFQNTWTETFNLTPPQSMISSSSTTTTTSSLSSPSSTASIPRLIHLTFSPLILHILCATLQHARHLLSAAINSGFRESGVQSLKALDPSHTGDGVMVAIRTNGIVFESVVGVYDASDVDDGSETRREERNAMAMAMARTSTKAKAKAIVSEEYLAMCVRIVNERFAWNEVRKQRLVAELRKIVVVEREGWSRVGALDEARMKMMENESWEERRTRKRRQGLERQKIVGKAANNVKSGSLAGEEEEEEEEEEAGDVEKNRNGSADWDVDLSSLAID